MRFKYSKENIEFLRSEFLVMQIPELTTAFNLKFCLSKTESQIKAAVKNHKITCGRKTGNPKGTYRSFTKEQAQFIIDNYKNFSLSDLTTELNKVFNMEKTEKQLRSFTRNHRIRSGRTGCFEKGNKPWNADSKGQGLTGRNKTSFKRGNKPKNWKPVGSERICSKDGYILVKTDEPNVWRLKHNLIWEEVNREIPPGHLVRFIDGNKLNCAIENLELISRRENLYLNRNGYSYLPFELKPTVKALAKVEIRLSELSK